MPMPRYACVHLCVNGGTEKASNRFNILYHDTKLPNQQPLLLLFFIFIIANWKHTRAKRTNPNVSIILFRRPSRLTIDQCYSLNKSSHSEYIDFDLFINKSMGLVIFFFALFTALVWCKCRSFEPECALCWLFHGLIACNRQFIWASSYFACCRAKFICDRRCRGPLH